MTPNTQGASWEEFQHFLNVFEDRFMGVTTCKDGEENCVCAITEFLSQEVPNLLSKERAEGERRLRARLMEEVRIGNLDLSRPDSWEKGYNDCLVKVLATLPADSTEETTPEGEK